MFGPRPTPSMCTHQAQSPIFPICGLFRDFGKIFSRPPVCLMGAYTGPPFSCGKTQYLMYLLIQFWAEKIFRIFLKFLPINPEGKWTKPVFSRFGPKNQFEVHRNAINRFLRGLDLNWQVFNNFHIRHPMGYSRLLDRQLVHFFAYFY